ncbi:Prefoldin [Lasiosphaeris hirsuta]|uniref:Prefoldin n=1 Tax=Lasiosphaeris hirsuta TaxID=260670 RepID=A0AA40E2G0_9PEZI|nr:Prefoldin [Lasiosphaeris hirsuta]
MANIQAKLQELSDEYTKLQKDLQGVVQSRQQLEAQKQENLGVQTVCYLSGAHVEFAKLKDDETIYKLIGPVLLKQDRMDAESTVNGRLEFIDKEISRLETGIKEIQAKAERKKGEIIQVQTAAQAAAGGQAPQA